ncbi:MAG TPA: HutD family protein [Dongiaceae bacterium]|nr:HutD family protein [Dongiaceae bacterium]
MQAQHLTAKDYQRMPWKNGQGSTTQLISAANADGGFDWRLSIAEVGQSGPFSDFSGYDRIITLIDGRGMVLTFNGTMQRRIDKPFAPLPFDGGWQTECALIDGPLRDFNLMVARRWGHAAMTILRLSAGEKCEIGEAPVVLLHVFSGAAAFDHAGARFDLSAGDTLHLDRPGDSLLSAATSATVAAIYLEPKA